MHLASALYLGPGLDGVVTFDRRLADAATRPPMLPYNPASNRLEANGPTLQKN